MPTPTKPFHVRRLQNRSRLKKLGMRDTSKKHRFRNGLNLLRSPHPTHFMRDVCHCGPKCPKLMTLGALRTAVFVTHDEPSCAAIRQGAGTCVRQIARVPRLFQRECGRARAVRLNQVADARRSDMMDQGSCCLRRRRRVLLASDSPLHPCARS
jgi:hypothetical protein